jgi:hypothetical protein
MVKPFLRTCLPRLESREHRTGIARRDCYVSFAPHSAAAAGFREYDRAMPVPEIFQVRCLETDELFDVDACNRHTAAERRGSQLAASALRHGSGANCS